MNNCLLKRRYQPDGVPFFVGDRSWEYVEKPKGLKWFFKRPLVRLNPEGFTYFYQGKLPLMVPGSDESDTHSVPWPAVIITLGLVRYAPKGFVWVAFLHDQACEEKWQDRETRADLYRESLWFAYDEIKSQLESSSAPNQFALRQIYRLQNILMVGGVKVGSLFGAC